MTVSYPYTHASQPADPCQTARELVFLAGPRDARLLPEDGVTDLAAIGVATDGARLVRLTVTERVAAAYQILASGGDIRSVCLRLGLREGTEEKWHQLQREITSALSGIAVVVFVVSCIIQQTPLIGGS